jgi:SAM-dependent methyltransferase
MIKNLKIVKNQEANNYFKRNFIYYNNSKKKAEGIDDINDYGYDYRITNAITANNLKVKSILEIGCATGIKLNQYQKILKSKISYGIDLSSEAITVGRKKYKNLKLLKMSSLDIYKIKRKFDLIICGFFLYLLDREEIFHQFNLIYKKINTEGYLIINDFDPLFKHTNTSMHNKNLKSFKMNYDIFLEESGLFKTIYKIRNNFIQKSPNDKKTFKSTDTSITLYKKINFTDAYPENI